MRRGPAAEAEQRSARRHTFAVMTMALCLRAFVLLSVARGHSSQWFYMRGMEMGLLAKSLVEGQGLSSPFGIPTGPTAFIAPVYPILVSLVFRVFGTYSAASALVIQSAQVLLNLFTIWLMMHVARRLFSERTAMIGGLVWACSLPFVWMPTIFWETSLSACLLMGLLAFAIDSADQPARRRWLIFGLYGGLTTLVNPALLLSVIAVAAWLVFQTRKEAGLRPLLAAVVFAVVFAPWPIRNARVFHAFIPLRTTVGFELWMGNHDGANGFLQESLFPAFNRAELEDYKRMGEVAYCNHKSELARAYIASHPGTFARMSLIRAKRFWTGTGTENGAPVFAVHSVLTTGFGLLGLWMLYRSRRRALAVLFALPLALFPLPYIITHAEFRYRILIDPLLAVMSAYAITELFSRLAVSSHENPPSTAPVALAEAEIVAAWSPQDCLSK